MKERDFQTKFTNWLKYNYFGNGAFELKITHTNVLPFSALREHQRDALLAVKNNHLVYKIPDDSRGYKPFDVFALCGEAFVVVMFYKPGTKICYAIPIERWVEEEQTSERSSVSEERAGEIGHKIELGKLLRIKSLSATS